MHGISAMLAHKNRKIAPCQRACPAGVDVPCYVRAIRDARFTEALSIIRESIPFAVSCAYACTRPCETACARRQFEEAVAIRALKRVAAERGEEGQLRPVCLPETGKRIAIIGSGPGGLTAAHFCALWGHDVVVFEARNAAGGMLRNAIPEFRLRGEMLERDIQWIKASGVHIQTEVRIESAEELLAKGYDAVLIASGAWQGMQLNIPGENGKNVVDGLQFLELARAGNIPAIGASVVVVGGGNTAIDAARVCRRLGANVTILYRRNRLHMPAIAEEIEEALEEGIDLKFLAAPIRIEPGKVICTHMRLSTPSDTGRPHPVPLGDHFVMEAQIVIVAIGQGIQAPSKTLRRHSSGAIAIDSKNWMTSIPGIFACGDAVSGPASIIEAIAQGKLAAAGIDRYLGGSGEIVRWYTNVHEREPQKPLPRGTRRNKLRRRSGRKRIRDNEPVDLKWSTAAACREASRCLSCDLRSFDVRVESGYCKDCGYCMEVCEAGVFTLSDGYNPGGHHPVIAEYPDRCIGCLRCTFICPDFAIEVREIH